MTGFFRTDGTGWLAWANALACDVDTFTWGVTDDKQIELVGSERFERQSIVFGQKYEVKTTPSYLSYRTTYFVKTEPTPVYGNFPVLHMQKRIGTSEGRFGKIGDEPLLSVVRLLGQENHEEQAVALSLAVEEQLYTVADYLALERAATEDRHEYLDGYLVKMHGENQFEKEKTMNKQMIRLGLTFLLMALLSLVVLAQSSIAMNQPAPGFTLKDLAGKQQKLSDYRGKLTVVAFLSAKCPISNAYNERIRALANDYAKRDIAFLAINASADETTSEIKAHADKQGFAFSILKDKDNRVADAYGAVRTPEMFVVDAAGVLRYHGRIDNSHLLIHVKEHDLRNALDELLAGKTVTTPETKALGCIIKRAQQADSRGGTGSVSDLGLHTAAYKPAAYFPAFSFTPQRKPVAKRPVAKPSAKAPAKSLPKIGLIKPANFPALRESWKGQVVVLNLWATWCAPCVAEMPEFVKLHNEYKDKGVKLIAISADDVTEVNTLVARFVRDKGLPFEIAVMDTDDPQLMIDQINKDWPGTLPSTFVYDKTGKLIYSRFKIIDREELLKAVEGALR